MATEDDDADDDDVHDDHDDADDDDAHVHDDYLRVACYPAAPVSHVSPGRTCYMLPACACHFLCDARLCYSFACHGR